MRAGGRIEIAQVGQSGEGDAQLDFLCPRVLLGQCRAEVPAPVGQVVAVQRLPTNGISLLMQSIV